MISKLPKNSDAKKQQCQRTCKGDAAYRRHSKSGIAFYTLIRCHQVDRFPRGRIISPPYDGGTADTNAPHAPKYLHYAIEIATPRSQ